jgi:putative membrane protein
MNFLFLIFVNALGLFIVSLFLPGVEFGAGPVSPIVAGVIITILNAIVRPIIKLLSFPLVLLSAGLFLIVINAFILYLTVYVIEVMDIDGVSMAIQGLLTYLLAAVILGLANSTIHWFLKE